MSAREGAVTAAALGTSITDAPSVAAAREELESALVHDRAGRLAEAGGGYERAIGVAERAGASDVLAESLRRLSLVRHRQHDKAAARTLCERSHAVAAAAGLGVLAGAALNVGGVFDLQNGDFDAASLTFRRAAERAGGDPALLAKVEQNLGIVANIRGDLPAALEHYKRSLDAFQGAGDELGCALAYNNLGLVSADQQLWDEADWYYRLCLRTAERVGDVYLRGLALMNRTEVLLAWGRHEEARGDAQAALAIFDQLGATRHRSETYRVLGVVARETGAADEAEARMRTAVALAAEAEAALEEAEAWRELALLYQGLNRNQDALRALNDAHRLFGRLDARRDMVDVRGKVLDLEGTYMRVVREWGQSIESSDSYTHGHCERVATYASAVAGALGLDEVERTTVRLGAYLHDVGKVRVPAEILNKPGKLTDEEFAVMKAHPAWGVELLAGVEFPWDIKPMIRWHHEKVDGSGYPDRLRGDEIPLNAQIIGIVDVYDALTTTRSYRTAMTREGALAELRRCAHHWRPDVYAAFLRVMGGEG
jgi:putative nucleotidyltransferase with HDIG domain